MMLIRNAKIVDPGGIHHGETLDIRIDAGRIAEMGTALSASDDDHVVSTDNLHVSIGWFDSGVSFGEPGYEERESLLNGLSVASSSGFTHVMLNPDAQPHADDVSALRNIAGIADSYQGPTQIVHVGTLTQHMAGDDLSAMLDMYRFGAVSFYDYKKSLCNAGILKTSLQYASNWDAVIQSFPYDKELGNYGLVNESPNTVGLGLKRSPSIAETVRIARDLAIAKYTDGKLHIPTISTAASIDLIDQAKANGINVTCSVSSNNLLHTDEELGTFNTNLKLQPVLRTASDRQALLQGLRDGTIDMITTDHRPVNQEEKALEFDKALFGSIGLESAYGCLTRVLDQDTLIRALTAGHERFGRSLKLEKGADACLTLYAPSSGMADVNASKSQSKNMANHGLPAAGRVLGTINGARFHINHD